MRVGPHSDQTRVRRPGCVRTRACVGCVTLNLTLVDLCVTLTLTLALNLTLTLTLILTLTLSLNPTLVRRTREG